MSTPASSVPRSRARLAGCSLRALAATSAVAVSFVGAAPAAQAAGPVPRCESTDVRLSAAVVPGSPGAGSYSEALTVTNATGHTCYLYGHPGVQRAREHARPADRPVGAPARWTDQRPALVLLEPGGTATAEIRQHSVGAYPDDCRPAATDALRIYLPDTRTYVPVPSSGNACVDPAYVTMGVGVFRPGS